MTDLELLKLTIGLNDQALLHPCSNLCIVVTCVLHGLYDHRFLPVFENGRFYHLCGGGRNGLSNLGQLSE